jgi:hypothetical protein
VPTVRKENLMDEKEILARIDALAERIGTTTQYLWTALVEDIALQSIITLVASLLSLTVSALAAGLWGPRLLRRGAKENNEGVFGGGVALLVAGCLVGIISLGISAEAAQKIVAPRLEAMERLTDMLK